LDLPAFHTYILQVTLEVKPELAGTGWCSVVPGPIAAQ